MDFHEHLAHNDRYLTEARNLVESGCYERAFELYLDHYHIVPESKVVLEKEFKVLTQNLNDILYTRGKTEKIFSNLDKAIKLYPKCPFFYNETGKHLYMCRLYKDAMYQFQRAIKLDYRYSTAECSLNSVKNLLVDRWHYRMLNDKVRNDAYYYALKEVVKPTDLVLDIGTGTGLLSLYAKENKPLSVSACDSSELMIQLARNIAADHEIDDINFLYKLSHDITPQDMGGKTSLVVTEMFDAGLFGEHILQTLEHAWENLLTDSGRVVPARAEFFVMGVESNYLFSKYHLTDHAKCLLGIPKLMVMVDTLSDVEPYDCDDLSHLNPKHIRNITECKSVFKIDFNSLEDIKTKLYGDDLFHVSLKAENTGVVNIIVGWFDLYVTEKIKITTSPFNSPNQANAWQQVVFYDLLPENVKKDESLQLKITTKGGKVKLHPGILPPVMCISQEMLRFLNDEMWTTMISECIATVCIYLAQIVEISQMDLVDLSPFPLFGFLIMKRGAHSLICHASCTEDKEFIMKVFRIHHIPLSKVTILVGDELQAEVFKGLEFHAIFYNILTLSGDYNPTQKELMMILQREHFDFRGLILPHRIYLVAQLVDCKWLNINNRVYDKNLHDYEVANAINNYQVSQNFYLDLTTLPFIPRTKPVIITYVNDSMRTETKRINIISEGDVDACICWYKVQLLEDEGMITTCRENSFIDCMAFLADPPLKVKPGENAKVVFCVDKNGPFKILITQ